LNAAIKPSGFTPGGFCFWVRWPLQPTLTLNSINGPTRKARCITRINSQTVKHSTAGQAETTSKATQSLDAKEQDFQKRRKEAEEARAKADKEAEKARIARENCDKARKNLSTLQNADTPRVYTTNAAGQRIYMDDSARASALANSQKSVSEFCK
jgi:hypothetical protein